MRDLTATEKAAFERDGVVHVRAAVDQHWVERMLAAVDRVLATPADVPGPPRGGGMDRHLYPDDADFRDFVFETPLARLAAQATDSEQVRIYFDQIFVKEAGADSEFRWHQDHPYWPIGGTQVASTWVALTPSTVEGSALEFVRGSNTWGRTYRPVAGDGDRDTMNGIWDGFGDHAHSISDEIIAFEDHPDRYDVVGFAVEPGDALLFDYRILHRSRGNSSAQRRVAVSWRWLGDDATWDWVRGNDPVIGPDQTALTPGDLITDDAVFPVVYQRDRAPQPA